MSREFVAKLFAEGRANEELRRTDPEAYIRKMEAELPENHCCLCRAHFRGYGHNPWPIVDDGVACDECNGRLVMVARLQAARNARRGLG